MVKDNTKDNIIKIHHNFNHNINHNINININHRPNSISPIDSTLTKNSNNSENSKRTENKNRINLFFSKQGSKKINVSLNKLADIQNIKQKLKNLNKSKINNINDASISKINEKIVNTESINISNKVKNHSLSEEIYIKPNNKDILKNKELYSNYSKKNSIKKINDSGTLLSEESFFSKNCKFFLY